MLDKLTVDHFAPFVGETFHLSLSETELIPVTLIAAQVRGLGIPAGSTREPFSLLFRPPGGVVPRQQIYRVEHERVGTLEIFLVPVTPDAMGPRLEAIFS